MAHHKSAKKRAKTSLKRKEQNKNALSKAKTLINKVYDNEEKEQAENLLKEAVSFLDKTATKGKMHKKTVARKKSALTKHVNKLTAAK